MKIQHWTYLSIIFFAISCKNSSNSEKENNEDLKKPNVALFKNYDSNYLSNPDKSDTLCISDIERAKNDMNEYNGVYVKTICMGCDSKPFEIEIEEVLKKRKFKLGIDEIGCIDFEGQTQGCYSGYIDLKMKEKYGENYVSEIEKEAEKLLIKNINENDKIISIYDLDKINKPQIINSNIKIESDYYTTIKVDLPVDIITYRSLFADITFIIEKNGTISNLSLSNWVNEKVVNEKFKQSLIDVAIKTLKKDYNNWTPGMYKGNKVRTENTLRVSFEK